MNPTAKSLVAAAGILASAGAVLYGAHMRDGVDVGGASATPTASVEGLVASRDSREVPEGDYFYEISNLLKARYVEPINDEQKLALGAIRGMIGSLGDADSMFMDKEQFAVYQGMREGKYEGIGAQLELVYTEPPAKDAKGSVQTALDPEQVLAAGIRIPKLTVVALVPGGPAEKAGVKIGDWVEYLDDHWVPNAETIASFRMLERKVAKGEAKMEQLIKLRLELKTRTKKTLLPLKARDKLLQGTTGNVKITWHQGKLVRNTVITKAASVMPGFSDENGVIKLPFRKGDGEALKAAINGKTEITIDLRNNAFGSVAGLQASLEAVAAKGTYGSIKQAKKDVPLEVKNGNPSPPKITLLVDSSTRGVAEVFALALSSAGKAKLVGPQTAGHRILVEDSPLPDGSGYSLAVGEYKVVAR